MPSSKDLPELWLSLLAEGVSSSTVKNIKYLQMALNHSYLMSELNNLEQRKVQLYMRKVTTCHHISSK